jgi:hypothetical protein
MSFRPKPGIFTKALKNHLKCGAFLKFPHNPYPLYVVHNTSLSQIRFSLLFYLKRCSTRSLFLSTNPCAPPPLNSHVFFTEARISMGMGWGRVKDKERGFQGMKTVGNFSNPLALSFSFTWIKVWAWITHLWSAIAARMSDYRADLVDLNSGISQFS